MRWSTDPERDEARAIATVHAALDGGIRLFDTARAYAWHDGELGHNERLLGRALGDADVRVATKGGMTRPDGKWVPDGRARRLEADCDASREALGRPIDLYFLHAPDPRTPLATSVRTLLALRERGAVRGIGLSNVTRPQLEAALALGPIDAVQIDLAVAARGGVVELCLARGLEVLAHTPLGGPKRAARVADPEAFLAFLASLGATPLPGCSRPETATSAARAHHRVLTAAERAALTARHPTLVPASPRPATGDGELVLLMGLPGAGKSSAVEPWIARGYERLNRDLRGGTMKALHTALDARLAAGVRRLVLDNTYGTRAVRRDLLAIAARHQVPVRCVWLDTPLADAESHVIQRILSVAGTLPEPAALDKNKDPRILAPRVLRRHARDLEPPAPDEGFTEIERVPYARRPGTGRPAAFLADDLPVDLAPPDLPVFLFAWRDDDTLRQRIGGRIVDTATCRHGAGPPVCWCRPPLPGLVLALAARHGLDPTRSVVVGRSPAHRALAKAVGARFVEAP
jgi:diketogulonate reductase-like aldo/keto reductase